MSSEPVVSPAPASAIDVIARQIAADVGTPFYLFEQARFIDNITGFRAALERHHTDVIIGYSFKTNYTPSICRLARSLNCHAEVVSRVELELARRLEFSAGRIIFNGPLKTADDIRLAVDLGALINLDHLDQVDALASLPAALVARARVGLRVNIDLNDKLLAKKIAKGGILPRFGMHGADLTRAAERLGAMGVPVVALHGHCSSSDRSPDNYSAIARELLNTRATLALERLELIDVGGGFSGRVPTIWNQTDTPSFHDYARAIFEPLNADPWFAANRPAVAIEPGMSVVADTISLVTRLNSRKTINDCLIMGADATFYNVRPTYHNKALSHRLIRHDDSPVADEPVEAVRALVGATCMERDVLLENLSLPNPRAGDLILIEDVGAYCSVLTPNFIAMAPPIVDVTPTNEYRVARRKQTFDDFFAGFEI